MIYKSNIYIHAGFSSMAPQSRETLQASSLKHAGPMKSSQRVPRSRSHEILGAETSPRVLVQGRPFNPTPSCLPTLVNTTAIPVLVLAHGIHR